MLTLFTTAVAAEDLIMRCGKNTYKYIQDPSGDRVLFKHAKATKNKYVEWCKNEPTKKWGQVSIDGWTRIIKDNKAENMSYEEADLNYREYIKKTFEEENRESFEKLLYVSTKYQTWIKNFKNFSFN